MTYAGPLNPLFDPVEIAEGKPTPLAVFRLRAWARAYLWAACMIGLYEAVDELQEAADREGIEPDAAQEIMAAAFGGRQ